MTRRVFGHLLAALSAGAAAPTVPAVAKPRIMLADTYVAGLWYHRFRDVRALISPGTPLVLRREPSNRFDHRAIEVLTTAGVKIGYVPRWGNEPFARLMDSGRHLEAEVLPTLNGSLDDVRFALYLVD